MSNVVPDGWSKSPLNTVVERIRTPVQGDPKHVLTISSTSGWVDQRQKWARNMAGDSLKKYTYLNKGEFSYNRGNSKTFPYGCVFKLTAWNSAAVPNVYHSFRVDKSKVDPDFIQHSFHGGQLDSQLRSIITSSARANGLLNITAGDFFDLEITYPPLPEQKKIAAILSSVDDVIEKVKAQIDKLKDLKTGLMQELLTKGIGHAEFKDSPVGLIPVGWDVVTLSKKATLIPGYAFSSSDFVSNGAPLIRMGNLYQNQLDLKRAAKFLPSNFIEKHPKFCVYPNDIVFSMTGTAGKEDYGFAVQVPENTAVCLLNQRVAKIVPNDDVAKTFLLNLLRSRLFLDEIYSVGAGTKQANLSSANILSIDLPFPPLEEQIQIADTLDSLSNRINSAVSKVNHLTKLKKALMQDLLTGIVRVKVD